VTQFLVSQLLLPHGALTGFDKCESSVVRARRVNTAG
jgi:hypothetical protein